MPDAIVERDGHIMTITMNRPERYNALTGEMLIRMYDAYREADADPDVRVIIVTGADGNFCSGADLKGMAMPLRSAPEQKLPSAPVTMITRTSGSASASR